MTATLDKDLTSNETYFDEDLEIENPDFAVMINADGYPVSDDAHCEEFNFEGELHFE
ncbi:MAG: hypothetical protein OEY89_12255 [Gammaproteobacteria bacterium]|nr:hypothetical protein [Gammaproteobacteria bacterium]